MDNLRFAKLGLISILSLPVLACSGPETGDGSSGDGAELTSFAETSEASADSTSDPTSASATSSEGTDSASSTSATSTTSMTSATSSATSNTAATGDGDGDGETGIECTPELTGNVPGCPCKGVPEGNLPPFWCGDASVNLICEEATQTCTESEACDVVSPEPEPNDDLANAVDLGMHCNGVIAHGQLQPGDVDWFTWAGFHPTAGCGSRAQVDANNPNIEVCIYEACIDDVGTMDAGFCMGAQSEDDLGPNTAGCCATSFARDPENTITCANGQVWMVRVESTANECMAYELEMG